WSVLRTTNTSGAPAASGLLKTTRGLLPPGSSKTATLRTRARATVVNKSSGACPRATESHPTAMSISAAGINTAPAHIAGRPDVKISSRPANGATVLRRLDTARRRDLRARERAERGHRQSIAQGEACLAPTPKGNEGGTAP